jgi:phosphatidylinositol glycan class W
MRTRLAQPRWVNGLVPQVVLLVLPLLFSITTFAFSPWTLNTIIVVPATLLLLLPARDHTASPLPSHEPALDLDAEKKKVAPVSSVQPLAALSTWRAHMMLMTALCILAVDFPVYPRELAKCETFGTGLVSHSY